LTFCEPAGPRLTVEPERRKSRPSATTRAHSGGQFAHFSTPRAIELLADCLRNIRGELENLRVQAELNLARNLAESPMGVAKGGLTNCATMEWCR
jgi:hypothetical protein